MSAESIAQKLGLPNARAVYHNLPAAQLVEEAVRRGEGSLTATGALNAFTGSRTGRSPRDKFVVDDPSIHDEIWWGKVNQPVGAEIYSDLRARVMDYMKDQEIFVLDAYAGADPAYRVPIRVVNTHAWQNLFVHQVLIRLKPGEMIEEPRFTVLHCPDLLAEPDRDGTRSEAFVIVNIPEKTILIGGTQYAGEIKKSVFSIMNYLLPKQGVLTMHCSANIGARGDTALFFGLSGTGKTTLSADPNRLLIGDDEHGWSDNGIFNIEGGCYAKCIRLTREGEPQIWDSIRFGAVLENVTVDPSTRNPDYDDDSITENTRVAYPVDFIPGAVESGMGPHPNNILFLSYDAFGVLPPIVKLTREQAMYHFMSGYTSKTAGTEAGMGVEPQPEFSACFGHPFLPLAPSVYADMLGRKMDKHHPEVWLVNTGLSGGPFGVGSRMKISLTRTIVQAALDGSLAKAQFEPDPNFGFLVPQTCPGVPADLLQPRHTWADKNAYDVAAVRLAEEFHRNFAQFKGVSREIIEKGSPIAGR
jgi:phosphoenolpyruvate carboxykinase (ATP)